MNTNLASFIVGLIIDENDRFYFVQKDGQTYALAKEEGQHTVGDTVKGFAYTCLLYTSPSPRDRQKSRMPSSA